MASSLTGMVGTADGKAAIIAAANTTTTTTPSTVVPSSPLQLKCPIGSAALLEWYYSPQHEGREPLQLKCPIGSAELLEWINSPAASSLTMEQQPSLASSPITKNIIIMNGREGPADVLPRGAAAAAEEEEEDHTARALLTKKGFDLDDLNMRVLGPDTPMTYFSHEGNVRMVRYLIARDADGRTEDAFGLFPLLEAAMMGHLDVMTVLFHEGGAHDDIRRVRTSDGDGWSPLRAALYTNHFHVVYWLLLNGALWSPHGGWFPWWQGRNDGGIVHERGRGWIADGVDNGSISDATMRSDLSQNRRKLYSDKRLWDSDKRLTVKAWAKDIVTNHDNLVTVLLTGTIDVSASTVRRHPDLASSPLVIFNGKSGILKLITQYMAENTPQQVRMLRQLMVLLPAFIDDTPFVEEEEEDTPFVEEDEEISL